MSLATIHALYADVKEDCKLNDIEMNNFNHVRQLFNYPSDIRRVMYTTNAIESVNSSLRKVTKKGFFENENSVFKIFYLRITGELAKKWNNTKIQNWAKVLNQLSCLDETSDRIARYIR